MKANYNKWRKRLAGETVMAFTEPDENDCGFYRLPLVERAVNAQGNNNGRWKVIGYKPVALFVSPDGTLKCQIGSRIVSGDQCNEQWHWFVKHPISEEIWREVAENAGIWPDFPHPHPIPATDREVTSADNAIPEQPLDVQHATAVDNAIAAALKTVTSEVEAAQALGSKNRIAELRLAADKAGKAVYQPLHEIYVEAQKIWSAPVKRAEAEEERLGKEILKFRESERLRIAKEHAKHQERQRLLDESNTRAADRAIASREPEPAPIVEPLSSPPIQAPLVATYGTRKIREEVKTFLDSVNDFDAVYTYFKGTDEVKTFLTTLATAAIKAGRTVPGTTTRTGLI